MNTESDPVRSGSIRFDLVWFDSIRFGSVRHPSSDITSPCTHTYTHVHTCNTHTYTYPHDKTYIRNVHVTICRQVRTYSFAKCFLVIGIQPTKCSRNIYNKMVTHIVSQFRFLSKLYARNRVSYSILSNDFLTRRDVL